MYPETSNTITNLSFKRRRQILMGITVFFIIVVIVVFIAFLSKPHYKEYALTETGLKSKQQFGYLNNANLYTFNGLTFNETNIYNGKVKNLNSGQRLPIPREVHWANSEGVLLTFDSSFYFTKVEDTLRSLGESTIYDGSTFTWYLDFKTNSLHIVNKRPISNSQAYYSERDGGFYYVPNTSEQPGVVTPLHFYKTSTHKDEVIAADLQVTDINSLQESIEPKTVNFIARDLINTRKERLYKLNQNGNKAVILEADSIYPTNNPAVYIKNAIDQTTQPDESDVTDVPAVLYDITNKKTRPLDISVGSYTISLFFLNDKEFYAIKGNSNDTDGVQLYYSGIVNDKEATSAIHTLQDSNGKPVKNSIVKINGFSKDALLVTTLGDNQGLFGNTTSYKLSAVKESSKAQAIIDSCLIKDRDSSLYIDDLSTFHVYFFVTNDFYSNIARFSNCVLQKDSSGLMGYSFQFGGFDPLDGRISTD